MRAYAATDAAVFLSAGFFIVIQIRGVGVAFLHAGAAADAEIVVHHCHKTGHIGDGRNHMINAVAAAAPAAVADAGFILGGVEIGMIGLVHQARFLGLFQDLQGFFFGN